MAIYTDDVLLKMFERSLEIVTDYMDDEAKESKEEELMNYILASKEYIQREGVLLEDTIDDAHLITMYSTWLYDKRKTTGSKYTSYYIQNMPRMLRYNLNNRLLQQKARET